MCRTLKGLLFCSLLLLSPLGYSQDTKSLDQIIETQELSILIIQRLTAYLDSQESIYKQESESLAIDREALTKERNDFEIYKASYPSQEKDLNNLKETVARQSASLARSKKLIKYGGFTALAIILAEGLVILAK